MSEFSITIVVLGACNSGKSSIINSVTKKKVCRISNDGKPMTLKPQLIWSGNKSYIDTPGLPKSPSNMSTFEFNLEQQPSMIWLVVNFQAAIENDEFDILEKFPSIPVLVILNKVDFCNIDDVEKFDNPDFLTNRQKLASVHKRLIQEKEAHKNIRHILVTSLNDECDIKRPPIGIDHLQIITNKCIIQNLAADVPSDDDSELSIAIIGYSSTGKSSMINTILGDNEAARIGSDGRPTTKEWTCYQINQVKLWDCPAVNKRSGLNEENILAINENMQTDAVWFMLNSKDAEPNLECELYNTLPIDQTTPVIVIINKVDNIRRIPTLTKDTLIGFSQRNSPPEFARREKLLKLRDTIYDTWPKFMNLKAVTVTSLTSDDGEQDQNPMPIGIDTLLDITRQHLKNDNQRRTLDSLKQQNKTYVKPNNLYKKSDYLSKRTNDVFMAICNFFAALQNRIIHFVTGYEG